MEQRPFGRRAAATLAVLAASAFGASSAAPSIAVSVNGSTAVAETTWLAPAPVSPDDDHADDSTLVVDPAGNTTVTWIGFASIFDTDGLFVTRRPAGGEWTEPVVADPDANGWTKTAAAPSGRVTALYMRWRAGPRLWSVTVAPDGTPEAPVRLSAAGTKAPSHDLAVDAAGTMTAVWVERLPDTYLRVMVSRRIEGGTWSTPRFLSGLGYAAYHVEVDAAPSGEVAVAWSARSKAAPQTGVRTWARTLVPGDGWSPPAVLSASERDAWEFTVVAGAGGRARVAWTLQRNDRNETAGPLLLSFRRVNGSWTRPVAMTSGPNHVAGARFWRGPGSIALTWARYSETDAGFTGRLFFRIRQGGAWSTPFRFSRLSEYAEPAQAAYGPDGRLTLTWMYQAEESSNGDTFAVLARTRRSDGTWESVVTLTPFNATIYPSPSIGVDSAGAAHAAWISQFRVWVADQVAPTG